MRFGLLGPLEVRAGDDLVEVRRGIPRTLLTALVLRAGETVTTDALVDLLWGDDQPQNPANALQIQISYLRKTLARAEPTAQVIVTRPGGYTLGVDADAIDARRFEKAVRAAARLAVAEHAQDLTEALDQLDLALAMWRGEPLADVAGEPFALGEATRLVELRWEAVELRNDVLLALGRHREVVGALSQLVKENPLRERFHSQLMLALYRSGRQADALRAYEDARKVLVEELGLDPGPELQELEAMVLAQHPALEWQPPAGTAGTPGPASVVAPPRRRSPLPVPLTALIGRDVEAERVRDLLARNRIVTLTGPAGAGKTRLALEVAHQIGAGDVTYVDLTGVTDAAQVAAAAVAALGASIAPEEDASDVISHWFAESGGVLLLDTCEHVIAGAASVVAQMLRNAPAAKVLATSRRPLGLTGEIAWPVPPLGLAPPAATSAEAVAEYPAVRLFCERAAAVRPDFALTDRNAADVAAICFALDGLPLAIELAAARADVLTPAAIRARLENRFALLVDGSADVAARQQTLRAALDWSYGLLEDHERALLVRLSVFAGPFDLEAVAAVADDDLPEPERILGALVRQSVVMVAGDDRYRLLDTIRVYGREKLGLDERRAVERLHAEHYARLAETADAQVRGPHQVEWLGRLREELANFRAALRWSFDTGDDELALRLAGSLAWFWTLEGMLDEASSVLGRAATIDTAPPGLRARVLAGHGLLAASLGDLEGGRESGRRAVELARVARDRLVLGYALNTFAVAQWALGELADAATSHEEALHHFTICDDAWGRGLCMVLRARTAIDAGEDDALDRAVAALGAARASGDRHVVGVALEQLARLELIEGDAASAAEHATECLALHEAIGYTEGMVAAVHLLGRARLADGALEAARSLHLRGLALATDIGHRAAVCEAVEGLARVALATDQPEAALRLLHVAAQERRVRGIPLRASDRTILDVAVGQATSALADDVRRVQQVAQHLTIDSVVAELLSP